MAAVRLTVIAFVAGCMTEPARPACQPAHVITGAITTDRDYDPWLSEDRLELLFISGFGRSSFDVFRATRASFDVPFEPPAPVEELSTTAVEGGPFISDDGKTIWFSRGTDDTTATIFTATRPARGQPFGEATEVTSLGRGEHPSLTSDGLTIYFTRVVGNNFDIVSATRASASSLEFTGPQPVAELHTGYNEDRPSISGDGADLYYDTDEIPMTSHRVVHAHRGPDGLFGPYSVLTSATAVGSDRQGWPRILRDGVTLVFAATSNPLPDGGGSLDLFIDCE